MLFKRCPSLLTFTLCSGVINPWRSITYLPWKLIVKWTALITVSSTSISLTLTGTQACWLVERTMCSIGMSVTVTPTSHLNLTYSVVMLRVENKILWKIFIRHASRRISFIRPPLLRQPGEYFERWSQDPSHPRLKKTGTKWAVFSISLQTSLSDHALLTKRST